MSLVSIKKIIAKCISFSLVIPAAKLFTREMNLVVSRALKSEKFVKITGTLQKELEYWRFLDTWEGHVSWHEEGHVSLSLASDMSHSGLGGALLNNDGQVAMWLSPCSSLSCLITQPTFLLDAFCLWTPPLLPGFGRLSKVCLVAHKVTLVTSWL